MLWIARADGAVMGTSGAEAARGCAYVELCSTVYVRWASNIWRTGETGIIPVQYSTSCYSHRILPAPGHHNVRVLYSVQDYRYVPRYS